MERTSNRTLESNITNRLNSTFLNEERYSRQILFSPIGAEGQQRLLNSRVAIVGMGALGTVLANHMVRAGVGYVRLIDRDFVEASNLQRQMLYDEQDASSSAPKAIAAANRLRLVNSSVTIEPHVIDLNQTNAESLLSDVHLILDGSDNFAVRFLINDVSIKHHIPWIYGGAVGSRGVTLTILPETTPCLRCMFGQAPAHGSAETCDTSGVIGSIIHVVASYQAIEALKILTNNIDHLNLKMTHFDLWINHNASVDVSKARKVDCPACAQHRYEYLNAELQGEYIQALCGRNSVQIHPVLPVTIELAQWAERLRLLGSVEVSPFLLKFHIDEQIRLILFPDGRAIVQGIEDIAIAKSIYSRYVGM